MKDFFKKVSLGKLCSALSIFDERLHRRASEWKLFGVAKSVAEVTISMNMLALICFQFICCASASTIDVLVSKQLITMNQSMTEQWYGKNGNCLLFTPTRQSFQERMQTCGNDSLESLPFGGTLTPFSFQRDNQPYGHCCTSVMPLSDRGFSDVIEGH